MKNYWVAGAFGLAISAGPSYASDHLDTPTVIADPAADIGDLYAWMSPDGRRLNLVMDIVGARFSDQLAYVFHIDSGVRVGAASTTTHIECRFDSSGQALCEGANDQATGDTAQAGGIDSQRHAFRVFAGPRNDPFFNNVRGTRQGYEVAQAALKTGVASDAAGCPAFDQDTANQILDRWRHTDGGAAKDFLAGWKSGALVVSIDIQRVNRGGPLLAVWAGTYALNGQASVRPPRAAQIDRAGRTLTGNALLGLFLSDEVADRRKEQYNAAAQKDWAAFVPDIQRSLGLYDAFDGVCGNQWLASPKVTATRYHALASLLADDRLWVDSRQKQCQHYMAVERGESARLHDCGGRAPDLDAVDVYRSLLVNGTDAGVEDGVREDDMPSSRIDFPFLAPP